MTALRAFEHTHGELSRIVLDVRQVVHAEPSAGPLPPVVRRQLAARLEGLREELIRHFANEEEALFPFVRTNVPALASTVDRLHDAHDAICGSVLRLTHLVEDDRPAADVGRATVRALHERFERAYTLHSQAEAALFEELNVALGAGQRQALAQVLEGL